MQKPMGYIGLGAQCLLKFHQAAKELADVAAITSESSTAADAALTESHAQVVYKGCVDKIKTLYASYMQVKSQYDRRVGLAAVQPGSMRVERASKIGAEI